MHIAVISDLHLGRRDVADHFGHEDSAFARFLRVLEGNFERIVLLGDIFETLTSRAPGHQAAELAAARAAHPELVRRFAEPRYHYIHGNHDLVAGTVLGAPEQLVLEADGVRMLFTHGHHHDWVIRKARWFSEAAVWTGAWLRRMHLRAMFRMFQAVDARLMHAVPDPARCTFQQWALARASDSAADIVVTGHTHQGMRVEHGSRLFLNSGTCSEGQFSFLSLDTRAGQYALHTTW
ncbi:serine/threonine protein phosphatase [Myxococcus llanfairpwllgwyngyllgogerychwyrndrobwllllantysiliogogogochensis]|uniref:Serine/threonine protein phosphatase n=1 Tax=Myxococcus llanfairpwllgwyngyllgogerychwyrndrobwllllantysiliogogogochensis TaxID=2590453 RepID=A0A540WQ49_9BACT|nr:metallophosphoesterase family protein [Myxococcus llanfairpwllgwyngyllgogerychwyrndrobwllllantysiliogogogochensis]TQF11141.1 serine/threonine protein phosphatase [Myxococcus llanfairpwllgwyngyllgogerychwyrndrobwllllantysiliogogogochensis]